MNAGIKNDTIPGTILKKKAMGDVNGMVFLDKIFFITDGIMLSQIREIAGIDSSTLQNWIKRGWVSNPTNKRYTKDQLARILIINMLRKNTQLERIDYLLRYINGNPDSREDDIIPESLLYEYITCIIDKIAESSGAETGIEVVSMKKHIDSCIQDYHEPFSGASKRLKKALEIIVLSYYSSLITTYTEELFGKL
ncbi:MAG: hypothetical protein A2Y15_01200 [Clostridiales bacterium GWF2_36_10]|nr:MAG: hypothetical protein A2Y15_01200 [Clostridiales bacterium GWF2_36_10]HAN22019.1 hypothetical protein [Clostridiales bacterium]